MRRAHMFSTAWLADEASSRSLFEMLTAGQQGQGAEATLPVQDLEIWLEKTYGLDFDMSSLVKVRSRGNSARALA